MYFFTLLGSTSVKVVHKTLVKLTPVFTLIPALPATCRNEPLVYLYLLDIILLKFVFLLFQRKNNNNNINNETFRMVFEVSEVLLVSNTFGSKILNFGSVNRSVFSFQSSLSSSTFVYWNFHLHSDVIRRDVSISGLLNGFKSSFHLLENDVFLKKCFIEKKMLCKSSKSNISRGNVLCIITNTIFCQSRFFSEVFNVDFQ